uniref:Uncharacterized protein n=1 Tax=Timema genevievae TaxID=629358 RepID=A0A7R9JXU4_TIMGE|nr:unnamed protein product [Timema genevievae]
MIAALTLAADPAPQRVAWTLSLKADYTQLAKRVESLSGVPCESSTELLSGGTNPPPLTQCCDCSQCAQSNMETSFLRLVLLLVLFFLLTGDYTSIFGQIYQLLGGEDPPSNRVAVKKTRDASKVPPTGDDADETLQILFTAFEFLYSEDLSAPSPNYNVWRCVVDPALLLAYLRYELSISSL